jgi:glutathione S-transferase
MQALHLYHIPAFRSARALWAFLELRAALGATASTALPPLVVEHFSDVARFRNDKPRWFLEQVNPNGKVPALVDPNVGATVFESCAVVAHLLEQYDPRGLLLTRSDARTRAQYHELAFLCASTLDNLAATSSPVQRAVLSQLQREGRAAAMAPVVNPANREAWDSYLAPYLERVLRERGGPFLLGDKFSAADVVVGHALFGLHRKLIDRAVEGGSWLSAERTPLLLAYAERVLRRPACVLAYTAPKELGPGVLTREAAAPSVPVPAARI